LLRKIWRFSWKPTYAVIFFLLKWLYVHVVRIANFFLQFFPAKMFFNHNIGPSSWIMAHTNMR
jgi:hypothetical protein